MVAAGNTLERVGSLLKKYEGDNHDFIDLLERVKKALKTSQMKWIPADQIEPFPDQPRKYFNPIKIKMMSESIDGTAQISPGMVRELKSKRNGTVKYQLVDGERRWKGVMLIPADRRPLYKAEVVDADDAVVQFLIAGMANFNREGHAPLETAETIRRYHREFKIPIEAVADLLGISAGWAYNILGLLDLPKSVQKMLDPELDKKKQLPLIAAMRISGLKNPQEQVILAQKVMSRKITIGALRNEVVKAADRTGTKIRIRVLSPFRRWQGRSGKIEAIGRYAKDLDAMLTAQGVPEIIRDHRGEAADLLKHVRAAIGSLNRCESRILTAQNKQN